YIISDQRGAAAGLALISLSIVITLPLLLRRAAPSVLIWACLGTGLVAGLFGLVRNNVGLAFLAAALAVTVCIGVRRSGPLALCLALCTLVGYSLTGYFVQHSLSYRDATLEITTAPIFEGAAHTTWFNLLTGIGTDARWPNSIDMRWNDGAAFRAIQNEFPLARIQDHDVLARPIVLDYVRRYPGEFLGNVLAKAQILAQDLVSTAEAKFATGLIAVLLLLALALPVETYLTA